MSPSDIHPTAIVDPGARIGKNVKIGAYAIIGDGVSLDDDCQVMHHVVMEGDSHIRKGCRIFPYSSIGTAPQDVTYQDEKTSVEIGQHNVIREFTTINRGTGKGGGVTKIGDNNYFMAYSHVAHDCRIGNHTIFVNGSTLAGHVVVEDHAVIGAFSSVHQFVRIGRNAFIGGYTIVLQDILPFAKISQSRDSYNLYGPNSIGMMRNGISREFINTVKDIFGVIYRSNLNTSQAVQKLKEEFPGSPEAEIIIGFMSETKRGILKNF